MFSIFYPYSYQVFIIIWHQKDKFLFSYSLSFLYKEHENVLNALRIGYRKNNKSMDYLFNSNGFKSKKEQKASMKFSSKFFLPQ
jgi:hypothetical protein